MKTFTTWHAAWNDVQRVNETKASKEAWNDMTILLHKQNCKNVTTDQYLLGLNF